ncbi:hypothetical protein J4416_00130 [Candidatus Pacearchaeota archaeon]|nr:hypothetical protein [Candidatus Pacearchaeota archaeon]
MIAQREEFDEDEDDNQKSELTLDKLTISLSISLMLISVLFLYILSLKTGSSFGFKEIAFGIVSGIVMTLFLIWAKFLMSGNKYLGAIIGFVGTISTTYALTRKYHGPYTTIFMSIGALLALAYIIIQYTKYPSNNKSN